MSEYNKKQLLIIGNGFDLACGLKSSYSDFFNERYKKILPNVKKHIFMKASGQGLGGSNFILHDLNQLKVLKESEKVFNSLDLFFVAEHFFQGKNVNRWCDVEELIKEIVAIITKQTSNEVPKYKENEFDLYIKSQSNYLKLTAEKLFDEIREFEVSFQDYIYKISAAYSYMYEEVKKLNELTKTFNQSNVLSFNYTYGPSGYSKYSKINLKDRIKSYRNIHGSVNKKDDIIFGIDSLNVSPNSGMYRFTKTYRIMANNLNDNYIDILDDDIDTIMFYGHSLGEADFSYFESIFDYYKIYDSKVTLEFYCALFNSQNKNKVKNNGIKREHYGAICKLLYKYGESIGGMKGKNLVHKLLLENRLKIHYEETR